MSLKDTGNGSEHTSRFAGSPRTQCSALLGWLSRRGDFANRVTMVLAAYAVAFMVAGRPGNFYWGFLFVVVLMPGIAFSPKALGELCGKLRKPPVRELSYAEHG